MQYMEKVTTTDASSIHAPRVKFPRPKVLLLDVDGETASKLREAGYNVAVGSFGTPFSVPPSGQLRRVIPLQQVLPNHTEAEVIVVDVKVPDSIPYPDHKPPEGVEMAWTSSQHGVINPRPLVMHRVEDDFSRIVVHGGIFVVFATPRETIRYVYGKLIYGKIHPSSEHEFDNWSYVALFRDRYLEVRRDSGTEIVPVDLDWPLVRLIEKHAQGGYFDCTLHPRELSNRWTSLATSKFGDAIAGILTLDGGVHALIVPHLKDTSTFLLTLLSEHLPQWNPKLFPHVEGPRWVNRAEYELAEVLEIQGEIQSAQEAASAKINEHRSAIAKVRHDLGYLHDLLTCSGQPLVNAVKRALSTMGFSTVVDVDDLIAGGKENGPKGEDLRVLDRSPTLLVEIKGISGLPKDSGALQVSKYVAPRMREWGRTDVRGLAIVNHQRHVPGLDRDNANVFRGDIVANAEEQDFGLLTTWDLYRLVRNFLKHGWNHEHVSNIFYARGRIVPVPTHYQCVGVVEHFWPKPHVVGIRVEGNAVRSTDRIAYELPIEFLEQSVTTLEVERKRVSEATVGMLAGVATDLDQEVLKKGIRVFRVLQ